MRLVAQGRKVVLDKRNAPRRLDRCLLPKHVKLADWSVMLDVAGQRVNISGPNANSVFRRAKIMLEDNGEAIPDEDLWLDLNVQWSERVFHRRLDVPLENLLKIAGTKNLKNTPPQPGQEPHAGFAWLSSMVSVARQNLQIDGFDTDEFTSLWLKARNWADPTKNPSTGRTDVYRMLTIAVSELRNKPDATREWCAGWLGRTEIKIKGITP
jgi:hypothetical protein